MGTLADAFAKAAAERNDNEWIQRLGEVVRLAIFPFETGKVSVSVYEEGFQNLGRTFLIEIGILPNYPFTHVVDDRAAFMDCDPGAFIFDSLAKPLFNHYRHRPSLPVDDHIVLGED